MRLIKTIKRIAAIGTSGALIGATLGGAAFAQTLGEYPNPFVEGGAVNKLALVIGDAADVDSAAANDVSLGLQGVVTGTGGVVVTGGVEEDIPLGIPIASDGTTTARVDGDVEVFDVEFQENDLDHLFDGEVTYRSKEYDTSEIVVISAGFGLNVNSTMKIETSLTSSTDDYESDVFLEVQKDAIKYYYSFDEAINFTNVNSDNPLEITFLGKKLEIIDIAWAAETNAGTEFTANVGTEYYLGASESVTVEGKTITLNDVSSSSVSVDVDGVTEIISTGNTETVNGIEIKVKDVFSRDKKEDSSAVLVIGEDAAETYKDADPYIGENEDNPDWVWNIEGIDTVDGSTTVVNNTNSDGLLDSGIVFGVENDFVKDDDDDNPVVVGECYTLPNNFLSICLESLSTKADEYMSLTMEVDSNSDFSDSGMGATLTSEPAIRISTSGGEYLRLDQSNLNSTNGTVQDRSTDQIWLYAEGSAETAQDAALGEFIWVFWEDENNKVQYAGNITNETIFTNGRFAHIDYKSISGDELVFYVDTSGVVGTAVNVTLVPFDSQDMNDYNDNITAEFGVSARKFNSLGATKDSADAGDVWWFHTLEGTTLGGKDEDHRSQYGIVLKDPKSQAGSDKVNLEIPSDLVKGNIRVSGEVVSGGEGGIPSVMTASEVTDLTAWNAILFGGSCVNSHTAAVLGVSFPSCGTDSGIAEDTAIVELKANGDNWVMVVAGWELEDTRRAGIVMRNWADFAAQLAGKSSVSVTGTSLEVSGITVE